MSKQRLYAENDAGLNREGAQYTLYKVMITLLKLFAPFLPYVTEEIYQGLYEEASKKVNSIHISAWPEPDPRLEDPAAELLGERLVEIASAVRRYKSENNLPLSLDLERLQLVIEDSTPAAALTSGLLEAAPDLTSITRAREIEIVDVLDPALEIVILDGQIRAAVQR
jgi:valyl-tRNA synthetase